MIHRLHEGGAIRIVTLPPMLEGDHIIHGPSLSDPKLEYVQGCQDLNAEVKALHDLARGGYIGMEVAERQLNTYLLAASHTKLLRSLPMERRRWLLLPIADAPHHGLIPDLGQIIHRVLSRDPIYSAVSTVIEQCIPSMRHVCRAVQYTDSQEILLNLIAALLLGLFPGAPKKPSFLTRARLWGRVHAILTSTRELQTAFLARHQDILHLASMEYIARVVPVYLPAQDVFLTGKDAVSSQFFRRVPPVCDEFRQFLDDSVCAESSAHEPSWQTIQDLCASHVERVSRLKRSHPYQQPSGETGKRFIDGCKQHAEQIAAHWDAPKLISEPPCPDEYRLLGLSLGLHGPLLMQIQRDVQISPLPRNLARLQYARLLEMSRGESRIAHLRTRRRALPPPPCPPPLCVCALALMRSAQVHLHVLRPQPEDPPGAAAQAGHPAAEARVRVLHEGGSNPGGSPGQGAAIPEPALLPVPHLRVDPDVYGAGGAAVVPPLQGAVLSRGWADP